MTQLIVVPFPIMSVLRQAEARHMKKRIIIKKSISISKQLSEPSRYTFMGVKGMHPVALLLALSLSACSDSGSNSSAMTWLRTMYF